MYMVPSDYALRLTFSDVAFLKLSYYVFYSTLFYFIIYLFT